MSAPIVACVMLTRDRPAMARRAVESFRAQTYERKRLVIYDNGNERDEETRKAAVELNAEYLHSYPSESIGKMRNTVNFMAAAPTNRREPADIIAHWDSDDLSHPNRLAEQVALLQSSGADAVGYSDLLFWDTRQVEGHGIAKGCDMRANEAWLYTRPSRFSVPGTTLMFWRKTWEAKPFLDLPKLPAMASEDVCFQSGLKVAAESSIFRGPKLDPSIIWEAGIKLAAAPSCVAEEPRMIASIHGGNTMVEAHKLVGIAHEFKRVPEWDAYCLERMRLLLSASTSRGE